uniref:Hypothetical conserved protein n=1 Tax=Acetithermum autotrophicum TaxID=1446466 RepID=H5SRC2_ACEAU|nr:hypothetical conserved protein [Candidatus Acetothermum autotrophicum]
MTRTQIYLDEEQKKELDRLSAKRGVPIAELIRAAIDQMLAQERERKQNFERVLTQTFGMWRDRREITEDYVRRARRDWEKRLKRHGSSAD